MVPDWEGWVNRIPLASSIPYFGPSRQKHRLTHARRQPPTTHDHPTHHTSGAEAVKSRPFREQIKHLTSPRAAGYNEAVIFSEAPR
jgi:hypothetical protein